MFKKTSAAVQHKIYIALFSVFAVLTLGGAALSFLLFLKYYDPTIKFFNNGIYLSIFKIVTLCVGVLAFIVAVLPFFRKAKAELNDGSTVSVIARSFSGLFVFAYAALTYLGKHGLADKSGTLEYLSSMGMYISIFVFAIVAAIYLIITAMSGEPNTKSKAVLSLFTVLFNVLIVFEVKYRSSDTLINSSIRILSVLTSVALILSYLAESRYRFKIAAPRLYMASGFAVVFITFTYSLPVIVLSVLSMGGFSLDVSTMLTGFELASGIVVLVNLISYLKPSSFAEPVLDEESPETEKTEEGSPSGEGNNWMDKVFDEESAPIMRFSDENSSASSENDLPDDRGFVSEEEGEFDTDSFEAAKSVDDSDDDDDYDPGEFSQPFDTDETSDTTLSDMIDEESSSDGEVIDYEKIDIEKLTVKSLFDVYDEDESETEEEKAETDTEAESGAESEAEAEEATTEVDASAPETVDIPDDIFFDIPSGEEATNEDSKAPQVLEIDIPEVDAPEAAEPEVSTEDAEASMEETDEINEEMTEDIAEDITEKSVEEAAEESVEELAEEAAEEAVEEVVEETVDAAAEEIAEVITEDIVDEPTDETKSTVTGKKYKFVKKVLTIKK